jgi:ribosome biogenesis GTP-binding protein YsxC/EngB
MTATAPLKTTETPGHQLFAGRIEFLKSVVKLDQLPEPTCQELAFAGRSNVGKSSLINALTNRVGLARTSNTPGRTQEINYFDLYGVGNAAGAPVFRLVDLPGYGFAEAPRAKVKAWNTLVRQYLKGRANLARTLLLVDSRHGVKPIDIEIMKMLDDAAVSYQIVLTKADKIKAAEQTQVTAETEAEARKHPAAFPLCYLTSSEKSTGIAELRDLIAELG